MNQPKYTILGMLGTGSFGSALKCADENGSVCCIKKIKVDRTSQSGWLEQVEHEVYLLQNLKHPRIIKFLDCFHTTNHVHIVMELATEGPLSTYLAARRHKREHLDQYDVIRLFIDVLQGIEFLHMKNVVHKDIKSDNILIAADGRLKLADFGVSKVMNVRNDDFKNRLMTSLGQPKEAHGTPSYMAPETLVDNYFSFASDVWALGCIFYELCKLKPPFWFVQSIDELIYHTQNAIYLPIVYYDPKVLTLCSSMITPDRNERATIPEIISNDLIVRRYYRSYFDYGYQFKWLTKAQNNNNHDTYTVNSSN